jgi:translation elongation factor EF-1beta
MVFSGEPLNSSPSGTIFFYGEIAVEIQELMIFCSYGIKKLQITCVIEDDKISMDDLEENIVAFEDFVQSMDIVAFNKI